MLHKIGQDFLDMHYTYSLNDPNPIQPLYKQKLFAQHADEWSQFGSAIGKITINDEEKEFHYRCYFVLEIVNICTQIKFVKHGGGKRDRYTLTIIIEIISNFLQFILDPAKTVKIKKERERERDQNMVLNLLRYHHEREIEINRIQICFG